MTRDRLVAGLLDASLSERLQLEPDLMLQDAIKHARNSATVKQQQATVCASANGVQTAVAVDAMQSRSHPHHKHLRNSQSTTRGVQKTKRQQFNYPTPSR